MTETRPEPLDSEMEDLRTLVGVLARNEMRCGDGLAGTPEPPEDFLIWRDGRWITKRGTTTARFLVDLEKADPTLHALLCEAASIPYGGPSPVAS